MNRSAAVLLAALAALLWLAPGTAEASCQSGITYGAPASFESTDPCSAVAGTASVVTYGLVAVGALVYAGAMFFGAGTGIGRAVSLAAPARGFGTAAGQPGWPQPSAGSAGLAGTPPATPSGGAEPSSGQGEAPAAGIGGGQRFGGNSACDARGGDLVDVVSGQAITEAVDVELPGVLPLTLRRAYASGYTDGASFGPGWSSTLDQRLEFTRDTIRYLGDDAQVLVYPYPDGGPVLPVAGARWPLTRSGDTCRVEDPQSGWVRHFAPDGTRPDRWPLVALTDRNGNRITFTRDRVHHDRGYLVAVDRVETPAGPRIGGLRLLDGSPHGVLLVRFGYDERGRLTAITDSTGVPYRYEYDEADRISAWIDRNGYRYSYVYDADGRVVYAAGQDGVLSTTFTYDTANRVTTVTNALGHTTTYHYDQRNRLTKVVDPLGNAVTMEYDRYHRSAGSGSARTTWGVRPGTTPRPDQQPS